jgi:hypothetical protein
VIISHVIFNYDLFMEGLKERERERERERDMFLKIRIYELIS